MSKALDTNIRFIWAFRKIYKNFGPIAIIAFKYESR